MRRILIALGTTLSGLVLLFSWPTSLHRTVGATATSGTAPASSTAGSQTSGSAPSTDGSAGGAPSASGTFTGAASSTRYGPVQVQVTVTDGVITDAVAINFPSRDRHDQEINSYAIPLLEQQTLELQSTGLDMISGATVTSRAYAASLQDALDQAGL